MIGPPLSFALALNYGFTVMFLIAAATFAVCVLLVGFMLPSVPRAVDDEGLREGASAPIAPASARRNRDVRWLFIASMLMWTCNTLYIIDMPLYITADLGLPEGLAGVLMGTAAGLEIPAMLLAGYYVKRFGKRNMMLLAVAAGVLFYLGLIVLAAAGPDRAAAAQRGVYRHRRRYRHALFSRFDAGPTGRRHHAVHQQYLDRGDPAGVLQGALVENFGHGSVYWMAALLALAALWMSAKVREV